MRPARLQLYLLMVWLALTVLAALWPGHLGTIWIVVSSVLAIIVAADFILARSPIQLLAARQMPSTWALGVWQAIELRLTNRDSRTLSLYVHDHHPQQVQVQGQQHHLLIQDGVSPLPKKVRVAPGQVALVPYRARATARGDLSFGSIALRVTSPLSLWEKSILVEQPAIVRVYPNFAALTRFALLATDNRLSQLGILQRRRRGEGLDFHQLREYREGDSPRQVDWKASASVNKLISREYRDERDQHIVFLIDCGRRMGTREIAVNPDDLGVAHFDHALNAVLLLAYVALRQGDAVGFATFATEEPRFQTPRKSGATVTALLNALYDLEPSTHSPDYYRAAVDLTTRLKRRAMVVIISNLRDEDDESLAPALALLKRKHLVMFASLKERAVDALAQKRVSDIHSAVSHAAARLYQSERADAFRRVRAKGALTLEAAPADLPIALVNRYLDAKRTGAI